MSLPPLREELALYAGPHLSDGQPSWTLHDPIRNQFFRIDWLTFEILARWQMNDAQAVLDDIRHTTTLHPDFSDLEDVYRFTHENQLLQAHTSNSAANMAETLNKLRGSWGRWLLHNYLFFRIPLIKPDRLLDRFYPLVKPFFSTTFMRLTLLALVIGVVQVYREWDRFSATLLDTFSLNGMLAYGCALFGVKLLHELGHAFAAKRYGCRVPAMGIAFLVLWPVAYTDTNEVWKLSDKRQRLSVAMAGVATELIIAVWATLLWAFLPEGSIKSIAFILATLTWVTTLIVNVSPFMRFDGYFVLSDWLDIPNLHQRSFALARWDLRERLFKLRSDPPEFFSKTMQRGLIAFAWIVWIYRLVVFLGIAVLVYHFFIKAVGIFLFLVEIVWFILLPLWKEVQAWHQLWPQIRRSKRARISAVSVLLLLILFIVPWPSRLTASAYLRPVESFPIFAPANAQILHMPKDNGSSIQKGEVLLQFSSAEIDLRLQRAQARIDKLQAQSSVAMFDQQQRQNLSVIQQDLSSAESELLSAQTEARRYAPVAPFSGTIVDLNPDLGTGSWISQRERIALLVKPDQWVVEAYLDEEAMRKIKPGDSASYMSETDSLITIPLRVVSIEKDASRNLPNGILSSQSGGSVLVRESHGQLIPELAVYKVTLGVGQLPATFGQHSWRGKVVIHGEWEAPGARFLRSGLALLSREAGF